MVEVTASLERQIHKRRALLCALVAALCALMLLALSIGATPFTPAEVLAVFLRRLGFNSLAVEEQREKVLFAIRLPRVLFGVMIGAGLATSGAIMQGLFRNPLADPGLVGVSSGAALGAVTMIVLGGPRYLLGHSILLFFVPGAAFAGGLVVTLFVLRFARSAGKTDTATMLLAGIAINALVGAFIGYLTYIATDVQLRDIAFWSLGSLSGATWTTLLVTAPFILLAVLSSLQLAGALNAMLLGEAEAGHLGVATEKVKRRAVISVALAVGAGVAFAGTIGFIGLVTPHLLRLIIGPDHRYLLPSAALLGACLMLAADAIARSAAAPAELPIGIVTASLGAPFFLWLLARRRRGLSV